MSGSDSDPNRRLRCVGAAMKQPSFFLRTVGISRSTFGIRQVLMGHSILEYAMSH